MATVGAILKTRREELNLTLEDISLKTKVGVKFLAAIENEEFDFLPPLSYSIGFVRLYAGVVGLDAGPVAAQFKRESRLKNDVTEHPDEHLPDRDIVKKTLSAWTFIAIIAFLILLATASYGCFRATPKTATPLQDKTNAESTVTGTAK